MCIPLLGKCIYSLGQPQHVYKIYATHRIRMVYILLCPVIVVKAVKRNVSFPCTKGSFWWQQVGNQIILLTRPLLPLFAAFCSLGGIASKWKRARRKNMYYISPNKTSKKSYTTLLDFEIWRRCQWKGFNTAILMRPYYYFPLSPGMKKYEKELNRTQKQKYSHQETFYFSLKKKLTSERSDVVPFLTGVVWDVAPMRGSLCLRFCTMGIFQQILGSEHAP